MHCRGLVFADTIDRHHQCPLEGRSEEGGCRVRPVMLGKLDCSDVVEMRPQLRGDRHLVMHEAGNIVIEDATRPRPVIDDLIPQPLQLYRRILIKHDPVEIVDLQVESV